MAAPRRFRIDQAERSVRGLGRPLMGNVGLLFVGVVLLVNGLVAIGVVDGRGAAPLNLFVGSAQIVVPTLVLAQSGGDLAVVNAAWPSYLFGFTYLWFGLIQIFDIDGRGFGWYCSFVAVVVTFLAIRSVGTDPVFAVIWATWAIIWTLFFVMLGLGVTRAGRVDLGHFTGWFVILLGIPTCTVPALLLLNGLWTTSVAAGYGALVVLAIATVLSVALAQRSARRDTSADVGHDVKADLRV
ncbi:urea/amide ABC transporter transmembrane protein [Mycolicibacterium brisbanense]|uniref:Urea/amide ABC transporter transmembrane protein n=2 Tax=Mycolicibacterium brisbanense TaxID=146020 RepID=A0A124DZI2_9MYCO|nr:urea/amide ABC transporter transmembrane protein [Mycolicibacterium brisbanense]